MALPQLTPVENWTKIINDNFAKTDPANLNWTKIDNPCTPLNGAKIKSSVLYYANIGQTKLCVLSIVGLQVNPLVQGNAYFDVPANFVPDHTVAMSIDQTGYAARHTDSTGFQIWSNDSAVSYGNGTATWVHADGNL